MVVARCGSIIEVLPEGSDEERSPPVNKILPSAATSSLTTAHRTNFGSVLLHLAVESTHKDIRQATNKVIAEAAAWNPQLTTTLARETVAAFLSRGPLVAKAPSGEEAPAWNKHARLASVLLSSVAYEEGVEAEVRENLVTELVIVAHHELVCAYCLHFLVFEVLISEFGAAGPMRQTWIDVCQKANTDPKELIEKHIDKLLKLVLESTTVDAKVGLSLIYVLTRSN